MQPSGCVISRPGAKEEQLRRDGDGDGDGDEGTVHSLAEPVCKTSSWVNCVGIAILLMLRAQWLLYYVC